MTQKNGQIYLHVFKYLYIKVMPILVLDLSFSVIKIENYI